MADKKDTGHDFFIGLAWLSVVLFLAGFLIWYFNRYAIMDTIRDFRLAELQVVDFIVPDKDIVYPLPASRTPAPPMTLAQFHDAAARLEPKQLTPALVGDISRVTLRPLLIPFSVLMVLMALWAMFRGPGTHFRHRYDLGGLIKAQSKAFPIIAPVVDFNPAKQPVRPPGAPVPAVLPPFAEALAPEEWIAFYSVPTLTDRQIDTAAAARAFAKQLGAPWRGPMNLAPYRQVLLAAFCLKAKRKRAESDRLLGRLALCWTHKGGLKIPGALVREARGILKNKDLSGGVIAKCNQHAFENTALLRALATAREEGGVLAPAQFIWLRAHDRALWYPLNNLGRQAYHMEALGVMAHYKAEKMTMRPIVRPRVDDAVQTLSGYMKTDRARPVPQLDYGRGGARGIKKVKRSA